MIFKAAETRIFTEFMEQLKAGVNGLVKEQTIKATASELLNWEENGR